MGQLVIKKDILFKLKKGRRKKEIKTKVGRVT